MASTKNEVSWLYRDNFYLRCHQGSYRYLPRACNITFSYDNNMNRSIYMLTTMYSFYNINTTVFESRMHAIVRIFLRI